MDKRKVYEGSDFITSSLDMWRIDNLLDAYVNDEYPNGQDLMNELRKGRMVGPRDIPPNVVTMNCLLKVTISDQKIQHLEMRLVYPVDEDESQNKFSVFSVLGRTLLGMKEGETKKLLKPGGRNALITVDEIIYQPEREGDYQI